MKLPYFLLSAAAPVLLALAGCAPSPGQTARLFSENIARGKLSEAKKLATEPTGNMIDLASQLGTFKIEPNHKFEIVGEKIEGSRATVRLRETVSGSEEEFQLVKQDGEWKVHIQSQK